MLLVGSILISCSIGHIRKQATVTNFVLRHCEYVYKLKYHRDVFKCLAQCLK